MLAAPASGLLRQTDLGTGQDRPENPPQAGSARQRPDPTFTPHALDSVWNAVHIRGTGS